VSRRWEDGAIREAFRTLTPSIGPKPLRAYAFLEVVGEDATEEVDLTTLGQDGGPAMGQPRGREIGQETGQEIGQRIDQEIGQDAGHETGQHMRSRHMRKGDRN
jgi:hypothetical protein